MYPDFTPLVAFGSGLFHRAELNFYGPVGLSAATESRSKGMKGLIEIRDTVRELIEFRTDDYHGSKSLMAYQTNSKDYIHEKCGLTGLVALVTMIQTYLSTAFDNVEQFRR